MKRNFLLCALCLGLSAILFTGCSMYALVDPAVLQSEQPSADQPAESTTVPTTQTKPPATATQPHTTAPAASPSGTETPSKVVDSKPPQQTFLITSEQSSLLATQVALPLFACEWDWVINYDRPYSPSDWADLPMMYIADIGSRPPQNGSFKDYWVSYIFYLDQLDRLPWDNGYKNGAIFGDASYFIDDRGTVQIPQDAVVSYFNSAFGESSYARNAAERKESEADESVFSYRDGIWTIRPYDKDMNFECADNPFPTRIDNGYITYRVNVDGMLGDWYEGEYMPWKITLQVKQNPESKYGFNVTGFRIAPDEQAVSDSSKAQTPQKRNSTDIFDADGFVFADSSVRLLTDEELQGLSAEALGFARNEIFARNGNIFRKDKYVNHYNSYQWYRDLPGKRYDVMPEDLNDIERANVKLIQYYESIA